MTEIEFKPEQLGLPEEKPSVAEICEHMRSSGELALQTGDFLSYSAVLDMAIGNPQKFSATEAVQILETLHQTLSASDSLIYNAGWDIPDILLRYLDVFHGGEAPLNDFKPLKAIMSLFSLLSERGNPQELFLKASELIEQFASHGHATPVNVEELDPRHENVKFCSLFELMTFSMRRIKSERPSQYFIEAGTVLLLVPSAPNVDILTVTTCLRRMFLLARDFSMKDMEGCDEAELSTLRTVMANFLTYAAESALLHFPLHWAERLYCQLVNRVALAPVASRNQVYVESEYTMRLTEAVERVAGLLLSFDVDPMLETARMLHELPHTPSPTRESTDSGSAPASVATTPDATPLASPSGSVPVADDKPSAGRNNEESFLLKGPSFVGTMFLATQLHFNGQRTKNASFGRCVEASIKILAEPSAGAFDAVIYWSLWTTNYLSEEAVQSVDHTEVDRFLDGLMFVAAMARSPTERLVVQSVVMRILRFQKQSLAFSFLVHEIEDHHAESMDTADAAAKMLKTLVLGRTKPCSSDPGSEGMKLPPMTLNDQQKRQLGQVVAAAVSNILPIGASPVQLLSLISVVKVDASSATQTIETIEKFLAELNTEDNATHMLRLAADTVKKAYAERL